MLLAIRAGRFADGEPFDPARVALIADGRGRVCGDAGSGADVAIVSYTATTIDMVTRSESAAFLVVSEIDYPGWQAYVDGVPVPITRTDYVLRGLEIGAGVHQVRMVFAPRSLLVGTAITVLAVGALAMAGWLRQRMRRIDRGQRPSPG